MRVRAFGPELAHVVHLPRATAAAGRPMSEHATTFTRVSVSDIGLS